MQPSARASAPHSAQAAELLQRAVEEASRIMEKSRIHVATYHSFYGALQARLKLRVDLRHPTMYTDAVVIGFNPIFVLSRTWEHLLYVVVHEVTHCALGHPFRRGNRDPKLWNRACDYVVNLALNHDPVLAKMCPPDALQDKRFEGMAAEQVYAILEREQQQKQQEEQEKRKQRGPQGQPCNEGQQGDEPGGPKQGGDEGDDEEDDGEQQELSGASGEWGDVCDAGASGEPIPDDDEDEDEDDDEGNGGDDSEDDDDEAEAGDAGDDDDDEEEGDATSSTSSDDGEPQDDSDQGEVDIDQATSGKHDEATIERLQREWEEAVMTAQLAAGGEVDDALQRIIGKSREINKSFEEYIAEFAEHCLAEEATWNRPNRRHDQYLPSRGNPAVKTLLIGVDTSASMSNDDLATCEAVAQRLMEDFSLKSVTAVYCDTGIRGIEQFDAGEPIVLTNAKGGGGTRFHPVFRYALEQMQQGEEIAGVVYLSDLEGQLSDSEDFEHIPTLWVCTNRNQTKFNPPGGIGKVCRIWE